MRAEGFSIYIDFSVIAFQFLGVGFVETVGFSKPASRSAKCTDSFHFPLVGLREYLHILELRIIVYVIVHLGDKANGHYSQISKSKKTK